MRRLTAIAVPVALSQLAIMSMGFVDLVMVGRVSVEAFAAVSLANPWQYATLLFANGFLMALDPIVSQAHGARDGDRAGRALQQGLVLALLMSPWVILAWTQTEEVLLALGQEARLAHEAERFLLVQIPSVPFFLTYAALRQYLQGREIVRPVLWVVLIGNVVNALANWVLVFGKLGVPALGLVGSGLATSLTRIAMFGAGVGLVVAFRLHEGAWVPWSRAAFAPAGLRALLAIGFPISLQMSLEMWAFAASNLIAGRLGAEAVAAHGMVMNLASITFMVPLGIAQGTAVRVGNLIGAGELAQSQRAAWLGIAQGTAVRVGNLIGAGELAQSQRAAWLGIAMGAGFMTLSAVGFVIGRDVLPRLYTPEAAMIAAAAAILPIAGAFQVFDGTQSVASGVLRAMGRPGPAALFNLVGYWVLALPLGAWLALGRGAGLVGLWWGLCAGLVVVAIGLVLWIWRGGVALVRRV
jgi:MATE family multidrug resistance protein